MLFMVITLVLIFVSLLSIKLKFSYLSLREIGGILTDGMLAGIAKAKLKNNEKKKIVLEKQLKEIETQIRYS